MTMRDADYRRAVETAAELGAKIEYVWRHSLRDWDTLGNPCSPFNWDECDYRVAPAEPRKPREWWIALMPGNLMSDKGHWRISTNPVPDAIHVREVLPEPPHD